MKKLKNRAFTLAEVMIVLTVIGVLSAILLPVAFHSTPDKNILKFKRAHNTFASAIRELSSNGMYYMAGDFQLKPDGSVIDDNKHFCKALASVINTKNEDCEYSEAGDTHGCVANPDGTYTCLGWNVTNGYDPTGGLVFSWEKYRVDAFCIRDGLYQGDNVVDANGVYYLNLYPFILFPSSNYAEFKDNYKVFCIDIDGKDGIKPFGYGIREDGKIFTGRRADWWLKRDITKKETDCCPRDIATTGSENHCDTGDTICAE